MNCPRCQQPAEPDAAFCGNCGQALQLVAAIPTMPAADVPVAGASEPVPLPAYAVIQNTPEHQQLESKAMTGLIISVLAVPGALIPVLGAALAVAGLVLSTTARGVHKTMRNTSVAFACLGIILAVGLYIWSFDQTAQSAQSAQSSQQPQEQLAETQQGSVSGQLQPDIQAQIFTTPCYSFAISGFDFSESADNSCKLWMRDEANLADASNAYSIDALGQQAVTSANLADTGRELARVYLASSLPGFTITSQAPGSFAGSQAYIINGRNASNVAVQMALVLHPVAHGENLFVIVHAINEGQANVANLEPDWQWQ